MRSPFARSLTYAKTEIRTIRRLVRFWLIVFFLTLLVQFTYMLSCISLGYLAPYDPTLGAAAPKYLLGTIDPTFFLIFQSATLLLLFDATSRTKRERIAEVLDNSPLTNFESLSGRVLGISILVWAITMFNLLFMQLVGSFSAVGWAFVESLQWHSVINLMLIDAPANLLFWTSFIVLVSVAVRSRILIVVLCGLALFGWYWLVSHVPYSYLSVISPSSNDTLFVSEIQPALVSLNTLLIRAAYVLAAGLFLVLATLITTRFDDQKARSWNGLSAPIALVLVGVLLAGGTWGLMSPYNQVEKWRKAHVEYDGNDNVDVQKISGTVNIEPNKRLYIDLVLDLLITATKATNKLVFSLNPALKIDIVDIIGFETTSDFTNGLLEIRSATPLEPNALVSVRIAAHGIPNPNFGYIDSPVDYLTSRDTPISLTRQLGTEASLFNNQYVALTPAICWYPVPGTMYESYGDLQRGRDFFEVSLEVNIEPNKRLYIDLVLDLLITATKATNKLVFSLNPALKIDIVDIIGFETTSDFTNGLLEIRSATPLEPNALVSVRIAAHGIPNPNFGYIDSPVDYLTSRDTPISLTRQLGTEASLFNNQYVALTPAICWYPVPGTMYESYGDLQRGRDFFEVSLEVQIKRKSWSLVASGEFEPKANTFDTYLVSAKNKVPEIGLFASHFEHASVDVAGIRFSAYLHKRHSNNLRVFDDWNHALENQASRLIEQHKDAGIPIAQTVFNFVEIPRSLRTVGGGWRMEAKDTLPGLVLTKEHGFPRANFKLAFSQYEQGRYFSRDSTETQEIMPMTLLFKFFETGSGSDAPWMSLYKHQWDHWTSPDGDHALVIDEIVKALISSLHPHALISSFHPFLNRSFSVYSTARISDLTSLDVFSAGDASYQAGARSRIYYQGHLASLESSWASRPSVWRNVEQRGFSDLPTEYGHEHDLELVILKSREIAKSLLRANEPAVVYSWIDSIRREYRGQTFTYDNLIDSAEQRSVLVHPFLTDWITKDSLPAFVARDWIMLRISDDENGDERYQLTVTLQNTQSADGHVSILVPTKQTADWQFPTYLTLGNAIIPGYATRRFNIQLDYSVNSVGIDPGLSLNRENFYLDIDIKESEQNLELEPAPFEESVANLIAPQEIIIDNLDAGFSVDQKLTTPLFSASFGPASWFDGGRSLTDSSDGLRSRVKGWYGFPESSNVWRIWTSGPEAIPYGRYRQTTAFIWAQESIPTVSFKTVLPDPGIWKLEYFDPWTMYDLEGPGWHSTDNIKLEITQQDTKYEVPLNQELSEYGWNFMGEFELTDSEVKVDIVFTPNKDGSTVRIFADAIRWTKKEE